MLNREGGRDKDKRNDKFRALRLIPVISLSWAGCISSGPEQEVPTQPLFATVNVDVAEVHRIVPPLAYGIHASLYDNSLHDPALKEQLDDVGISLIRWPGGGYSDNYHFATHEMSPWANGERGYLARDSDFGGFVSMLDRVERVAMITVNYGSNQFDSGPGEPKEAAAWVAYANGEALDETVIGVDGTGYDWQTVGFWATLRGSEPVEWADDEEDDRLNFLRIGREEPLGIGYWEVGNEVFGNGYYVNNNANYSDNDEDVGFELDMHVPYDGTNRFMHELLSPSTYGAGVAEYVREMKAVDPTIKIGAVLVTPPADYSWAPTWNRDVLVQCGGIIDFGVIHWYPQGNLLSKPADEMAEMFEILREEFSEHAGGNADNIEITVTELGPPPGYGDSQARVMGLFAADAYLSFIRHGATNIDWLELHNATFLDESRSSERGRAYYGIQLAHRLAAPGDSLVSVETNSLDVRAHAAVHQDGSVAVLLINTNVHRVFDVTLEVPGITSAGTVRLYSSSDEWVPEPPTAPEPVEVPDGSLKISLPSETLALLEFDGQ